MKNSTKVDRLLRSIACYNIGIGDVRYSRFNGRLHPKIKRKVISIVKQAQAINLKEEL